MLYAIWHTLATGELYSDLGAEYYARRDPNSKSGAWLVSRNAAGTS